MTIKKKQSAVVKRRRKPDLLIGWREWIGLPELGIDAMRAKVDTGARSSALHAKDIETFDRDGQQWVKFVAVLDHARERGRIPCTAPLADIRKIKNSFGASEERFIIRTPLRISDRYWTIELSLADREKMTYPVLLGRTAIRGRAIIDAGRSYLCKRIDAGDLPPLPSASTSEKSKSR